MLSSDVVIERFVLSDFQENAYVISTSRSSDCVIVDPGMEPEALIRSIREKQLTPQAILITHGHWDHIGGVSQIKAQWPDAQVIIGKNERDKLTDPFGNLSAHFGFSATTCDSDRELQDGEEFSVAGVSFKALEVPGHSRGHLVYILETDDRPLVFCGDLIFAGGVGRTDFADGDMKSLLTSIFEKIFTLPDDARLLPGHGPATTVISEKKHNPYLNSFSEN